MDKIRIKRESKTGRYAKSGKLVTAVKRREANCVWVVETVNNGETVVKITPKSEETIKKIVSQYDDALERLVNR